LTAKNISSSHILSKPSVNLHKTEAMTTSAGHYNIHGHRLFQLNEHFLKDTYPEIITFADTPDT
jgi:hypothetical protein